MRYHFFVGRLCTIGAIAVIIAATIIPTLQPITVYAAGDTYSIGGGNLTIYSNAFGSESGNRAPSVILVRNAADNLWVSPTPSPYYISCDNNNLKVLITAPNIDANSPPQSITYNIQLLDNKNQDILDGNCSTGGRTRTATHVSTSLTNSTNAAVASICSKYEAESDYTGCVENISSAWSECYTPLTPPSTDTMLQCLKSKGVSLTLEEIQTALGSASEPLKEQEQEGGYTEIPEDKNDSSCNIEGVGWIVCPGMTFLSKINDTAFDVISSILYTPPSFMQINGDGYVAWKKFRDLANAGFIIIFLFVIFSQISGLGASNYTIKRMLPRLIIGAILVNVSFYISQIMVDISNILGFTLASAVGGITISPNPGTASPGLQALNVISWVTTITAILAAGVGVALAVSVPTVLAGLLAILVIVMILVGRQAAIIILSVISPFAFLAYILPNTESLFKKWWKMFSGLLLVFPIVSIIFGGSTLASRIINGVAKDNVLLQVVALGVTVVPLLIVPSVLKGSLNSLGSVGAKLSGLSGKMNARIGKKVGDTSMLGAYKKGFERNAQIKRAGIIGGTYNGRNPFTRAVSRFNAGLNNSRLTGDVGKRTAQQAAALSEKLEIENVEAASAQIKQANLTPDALRVLGQGEKVNGLNGRDAATRAAAANAMAASGDFSGYAQAWDSMRGADQKDRRIFAQAQARSRDRPKWVGQGSLATFAQEPDGNRLQSHDAMAVGQVNRGAYSARAMADASRDELNYVSHLINAGVTDDRGDTVNVARLQRTAAIALDNDETRSSLEKNMEHVEGFYNGAPFYDPTASGLNRP